MYMYVRHTRGFRAGFRVRAFVALALGRDLCFGKCFIKYIATCSLVESARYKSRC
jgi:hypothetical protein